MAFTLLARLSGTVVASGALMGSFVGTVDNGATPATFIGTVSQGLVNAYSAPCIRTGYRIVLNGVALPDADLVDYSLQEDIDNSLAFLDFTLVGADYTVLTNREMWTLTPVELWVVNGPPGAEREELRFAGYVHTASETGAAVKVSCFDVLGKFSAFALCHEIEPLAGMTRGEIVTELCADAGLTAVDVPDGAVYTKGIQAKNTRLLDVLRPFGEPEGWKFRWRPEPFTGLPGALTGGGALEAWSPTIKRAPLAADDVWDISRGTVQIQPPSDVPSRWVVRGYGAVFVDELGHETRVSITEVETPYAPQVAPYKYEAGVFSPTGLAPNDTILRLTQRITQTVVSRGAKVITKQVTEEGWYNPLAAVLVSNRGANAWVSVPLVYWFGVPLSYRRFPAERFGEIAKESTTYSYDADGNPIGSTQELSRYYVRAAAVMNVGAVSLFDGIAQDVYHYGNKGSFSTPYEEYGVAEAHLVTRDFDDLTGAESVVTAQSFGFVAPRSYISPGVSLVYFRRLDGQGQSEEIASWNQYSQRTFRNIVNDGTLEKTIEETASLTTYKLSLGDGTYNWGEFDSDSAEEELATTSVKTVEFNALSPKTYERVTREPGKSPVHEIFSGQVPQPRYRNSAWTYFAQEQVELSVDDPVAAAMFGFRREVVQNDYVQSQDEAERVVRNRRGRALAYHVTVTRNESHNRIGSTIFLKHPHHALVHRALMVKAATARSRTRPSQTGTYTFEIPI